MKFLFFANRDLFFTTTKQHSFFSFTTYVNKSSFLSFLSFFKFGMVAFLCCLLAFNGVAEPPLTLSSEEEPHPLLLDLSKGGACPSSEEQQGKDQYSLTTAECCQLLNILSYYQQSLEFWENHPLLQTTIKVAQDEAGIDYYQPILGQEEKIAYCLTELDPKTLQDVLPEAATDLEKIYLKIGEEPLGASNPEPPVGSSASKLILEEAKEEKMKEALVTYYRFTGIDPLRTERWIVFPKSLLETQVPSLAERVSSNHKEISQNEKEEKPLTSLKKILGFLEEYHRPIIAVSVYAAWFALNTVCPPAALLAGFASSGEALGAIDVAEGILNPFMTRAGLAIANPFVTVTPEAANMTLAAVEMGRRVLVGAIIKDSLWQTVVSFWLVNQTRALP